VPSFIEIPPLIEKKSCHAKLCVNGRTDGRIKNMMLSPTIVGKGINGRDKKNADKYVEYWLT